MNFEDKMKQSTLARILKAKAITDKDEWLKHHLDSYQFGGQETYEHFKGEPVYTVVDDILPEHLVCIKIENCFSSKQIQDLTGFEIVILDTSKEVIVYYLLCLPALMKNTVHPVSWRNPDYIYLNDLHNVDVVILGQVLNDVNLCIDSHAHIAGNTEYWGSIIRYFYHRGYEVLSFSDTDTTVGVHLSETPSMKYSDIQQGGFIKFLYSDDTQQYIIVQDKD